MFEATSNQLINPLKEFPNGADLLSCRILRLFWSPSTQLLPCFWVKLSMRSGSELQRFSRCFPFGLPCSVFAFSHVFFYSWKAVFFFSQTWQEDAKSAPIWMCTGSYRMLFANGSNPQRVGLKLGAFLCLAKDLYDLYDLYEYFCFSKAFVPIISFQFLFLSSRLDLELFTSEILRFWEYFTLTFSFCFQILSFSLASQNDPCNQLAAQVDISNQDSPPGDFTPTVPTNFGAVLHPQKWTENQVRETRRWNFCDRGSLSLFWSVFCVCSFDVCFLILRRVWALCSGFSCRFLVISSLVWDASFWVCRWLWKMASCTVMSFISFAIARNTALISLSSLAFDWSLTFGWLWLQNLSMAWETGLRVPYGYGFEPSAGWVLKFSDSMKAPKADR